MPALNLSINKNKFNALLHKFAAIKDDLGIKKENNPEQYTVVFNHALSLQRNLIAIGQHFFDTCPTPEGLLRFKRDCHREVEIAAEEFKKHRGVWHQIEPVLKALLGIFATLTIIPAVVVSFTKQGYVNTFFATPETNSEQKLKAVMQEFETQEQELDQLFNTPLPTEI